MAVAETGCTHEHLSHAGGDLYVCDDCGMGIEIITARELPFPYLLALMGTLLPVYHPRLAAEIQKIIDRLDAEERRKMAEEPIEQPPAPEHPKLPPSTSQTEQQQVQLSPEILAQILAQVGQEGGKSESAKAVRKRVEAALKNRNREKASNG